MEKQRCAERKNAAVRLLTARRPSFAASLLFLFMFFSASGASGADLSGIVFTPDNETVYAGEPCVFSAVLRDTDAGRVSIESFGIDESVTFISMYKREVRDGSRAAIRLEISVIFTSSGTYRLPDIPLIVDGSLVVIPCQPVFAAVKPALTKPAVSIRLSANEDGTEADPVLFKSGVPFYALYSVSDAAVVYSFSVELNPSFIVSEVKKLAELPLADIAPPPSVVETALYRIIPLESGSFTLPKAYAEVLSHSGEKSRVHCGAQTISVLKSAVEQNVHSRFSAGQTDAEYQSGSANQAEGAAQSSLSAAVDSVFYGADLSFLTVPAAAQMSDAAVRQAVEHAANLRSQERRSFRVKYIRAERKDAERVIGITESADEPSRLTAVIGAAAAAVTACAALILFKKRRKAVGVLGVCICIVFCVLTVYYVRPLAQSYALCTGANVHIVPEKKSGKAALVAAGTRVLVHSNMHSGNSADDSWVYITVSSGVSGWVTCGSLAFIQ